ncbi:MAG TPA: alkaline phosphatase family protein [Candidatus Tumulicola sp.]|nr:alkaline phosphatase family protein [Candidatus Tumulicola sp.]
MRPRQLAALLTAFSLLGCSGGGGGAIPPPPTPTPPPGQQKIQHVIIIFQENRTPDNLFHALPGADIANSGTNSKGATVSLVPVSISAPYDIDHSHHAFTTEYNSGSMNGWDLVGMNCPSKTCNPLTAFGYVPQAEVQEYFTMAETYTFADRMFQTNQGPSLPAHQYIISGTSTNAVGSNLLAAENPNYANGNSRNCDGDPLSRVAMIDPSGSEATKLLPCFEHATLMDELDAKGVSWRYYDSFNGGLWSAPDAISHIRNGADWNNVIIPQTTILNDIAAGQLRQVSWVIPNGKQSDHALSTDGTGPAWVASIVNAVGNSAYWNNTAIFITWDDWGGWFDHVTPQIFNSYELGFRVPLIVVSPYAKPGYVSHVQHEYGSILKFTEETFGAASIGYTDARADDLSDCFNYNQTPIVFKTIASNRRATYFLSQPMANVPPDTDF